MDILPAFLMGAAGIELILASACFVTNRDRAGLFLIVLALLMVGGTMVR